MSTSESHTHNAGPAIVRPGEAANRTARPILRPVNLGNAVVSEVIEGLLKPKSISRPVLLKRIRQWVAADSVNRKFQQFRPGSTNYFHNGEAKLWASPTDYACGSLERVARAFGLLSDKEELARPKQTPITGPLDLIRTGAIELCRSDSSEPE
jgi:hypothetical protein